MLVAHWMVIRSVSPTADESQVKLDPVPVIASVFAPGAEIAHPLEIGKYLPPLPWASTIAVGELTIAGEKERKTARAVTTAEA